MRQSYAHVAVITLPPAADLRAPGGAITTALCGSTDHDPPCPLAPHHTRADRTGDTTSLKILFAADPTDEQQVRDRIDSALRDNWTVHRSGPAAVEPDEQAHAERLLIS